MPADFCCVFDKNGTPAIAFRLSEVDTVEYAYDSTYNRKGCYIGVRGSTVFVPNADVNTVLETIKEGYCRYPFPLPPDSTNMATPSQ